MGRDGLPPLRVSQRSNGLAFSQHHFLSSSYGPVASSRPSKKIQASALGTISANQTGNPTARNKGRKGISLDAVDENGVEVAERQVISSLIPPATRPVPPERIPTRTSTARAFHLPSSSATSIRSFSSSVLSRKRKYTRISALDTLPPEILDQIFAHLPQASLRSLMLTSTYMVEAAAIAMYEEPAFASTYRFAQFVSTVVHSQSYAEMVRSLDLCMFSQDEDEDYPLAGWREWKYRSEPLYSIQRENALAAGKIRHDKVRDLGLSGSGHQSTHPKPNPFLKQWSLCRDVPMGAIVHVMEACNRLKRIDLSYLTLAPDYAIKSKLYPATAFTHLIFVSDVPKSWTWQNSDLTPVKATDLVDYIIKLPQLESLRIKKGLWLSTDVVKRFVSQCPSLQHLDLQEAGMIQGMNWAIRGSREEVKAILYDSIGA